MIYFVTNQIKNLLLTLLAALFFLALPNIILAAPNPQMNYQGKLTNAAGVAVPDGLYNMHFWLLDDDVVATSSALWTENRISGDRVQVVNGLFSVMLGEVATLSSVDFNQVLYLGVEVGGISTSTPVWDGEMSPRKILGTVPAAFEAQNSQTFGDLATTSFLRSNEADTMEATSSSALLSLIQNGTGKLLSLFRGVTEIFTVLNNGNVGIGTSTPAGLLSIASTTASGTGSLFSISTSANLFTVLSNGNVGIGSSTPSNLLSVAGTLGVTGISSLATTSLSLLNLAGDILPTTDITRSLGSNSLRFLNLFSQNIYASSSVFTNASTTNLTTAGNLYLSGLTTGSVPFISTGGLLSQNNANFFWDNTNARLGIGTTSPVAPLAVSGEAYATFFTAASSTATSTFAGTLNVGAGNLFYNSSTTVTSISSLELGNLSFDSDAGVISWINLPVTTASAVGTVQSYSAQIGDTSILTLYGEADGSTSITNPRIGIGTSTPTATLSIQGTGGNNPLNIASSTGTSLFTILQNGNVGIGSSTPSNLLSVAGTLGVTGQSTLANASSTNLTVSGQSYFNNSSTTVGTVGTLFSTFANLTNASTTGLTATALYSTNLNLAGAFRDSINSAGTLGQVLWATGTSTQWVATSSLGITGGSGVTGGTDGFLARWTGATSLSTGLLLDNGTVAGVNATSSNYTFNVQGSAATNPFNVASSTGTSLLTVLSNGNVGIGSSTPSNLLSVAGTLGVTGISSLATTSLSLLNLAGDILPTTDITRSLGSNSLRFLNLFSQNIYASSSVFTNASTTNLTTAGNLYLSGLTTGSVPFISTGGLLSQNNANFFWDNTNARLGLGTTTPTAKLSIQGAAGTANTFNISSSTGSTTLAMLASGDLELGGQLISAGVNWTTRSGAQANNWKSITYGNGLFVAVSSNGTNRVMTSPDAITWTARSASQANSWNSVTYGNGLFVAVSDSGTNRVMTSPDGITWTARSASEANGWYSVTYGNGLFVAVSYDGTNRVMTSPDGITWTARSAAQANSWYSVTYGNGLFVAVSADGTNRVMTSPDGITWTARSAAQANSWYSVTYGNGLFVAVSADGTNQAMTSPDGIIWTVRLVSQSNGWNSITYGNGLFVAVSFNGNLMTSGKSEINQLAHNNIYQGGTSFFGGFRVGTSTVTTTTAFIQGLAGQNPFSVASSTGTSLFTVLANGNVGIGSSTPVSTLSITGTGGINPLTIASSTGQNLLTLDQQGRMTFGTSTTANVFINGGSTTTPRVNSNSIAIGNEALFYTSTSSASLRNIALGYQALYGSSTDRMSGENNLAFGYQAGFSNTTGSNNSFIGYKAGFSNVDGLANAFTGYQAGTSNTSGSYNAFTGYQAGTSNTSGSYNAFIGQDAGNSNTTGSHNSFIGEQSGASNQGGSYNSFIGNSSGLFNKGSYNAFIGQNAGRRNTTGSSSIAIGPNSLYNPVGSHNIAIGDSALYSSTGAVFSSSTAIGISALQYASTSGNTALGYYTGIGDGATGNQRSVLDTFVTFLGFQASRDASIASTTLLTNITALGKNARVALSNSIVLGGTGSDAVTVGIGTTSPNSTLTIRGTGSTNPLNIASSTGTSLFTVLANGNVGISSSTPEAKLAIENLNFATAGVAGIDQYFSFTNNTASAVQYGNRTYLYATNTATTTIVGSILRLADSTTFGNTVRGLEVQVDKGNNTQGENTALSGFARTFGVRGTTAGDAGGTYEPAGVYGETTGTTQGNALRGYSSTITTASLLKLFQDSSTYVGTGLLMNFGNSGGSFSSTTASKFIDLQNAGTSMFSVGAYGKLTIGDGTTNNNAGIQVGYGGICVDNDGSCNASTTGRVSAVSYHTGNSDLAETYFSDENLKVGDVVYLKGGLSIGKADEANKEKVIGVVSTKPGLLLGFDDTSLEDDEELYPIALAGRVPVRLSNENGEIKTGDELMLSSVAGVVMKATSTGKIVGIALEDFNENRAYSDTYINQFGDDLVDPVVTPISSSNDPRINDGCYYGAGNASGEAPCVPLVATTTDGQVAEAEALAIAEAQAEALAALANVASKRVTLGNGEEVKIGQIVMFVTLKERYLDANGKELIAALLASPSSAAVIDGVTESVWQRLVTLANNFVDGVLSVFTLKADRIEVKNELCVDGVCVDAATLQQLLQNAGQVGEAVEEEGMEGEEENIEEEEGEEDSILEDEPPAAEEEDIGGGEGSSSDEEGIDEESSEGENIEGEGSGEEEPEVVANPEDPAAGEGEVTDESDEGGIVEGEDEISEEIQ